MKEFNEGVKELDFEIAVHFEQLEELGWDLDNDMEWIENMQEDEKNEWCAVVSIRGDIENPNTYLRFEKWVDFGRMMRGQDEPTGDDEKAIEDTVNIMNEEKSKGTHFPNSNIKDFSVDENNCYHPAFKNFETQYDK